jgi:hypothetical protein
MVEIACRYEDICEYTEQAVTQQTKVGSPALILGIGLQLLITKSQYVTKCYTELVIWMDSFE